MSTFEDKYSGMVDYAIYNKLPGETFRGKPGDLVILDKGK